MGINENINMELRRAKSKLRIMEFIFQVEADKINHVPDAIPYDIFVESLIYKSRNLFKNYNNIRKEMEILKQNPIVQSSYIKTEDTCFEYELACLGALKRLSEKN